MRMFGLIGQSTRTVSKEARIQIPLRFFSGGISCWVAEFNRRQLDANSTPEWRNENMNVNKYFISSNGSGTHNQSA